MVVLGFESRSFRLQSLNLSLLPHYSILPSYDTNKELIDI